MTTDAVQPSVLARGVGGQASLQSAFRYGTALVVLAVVGVWTERGSIGVTQGQVAVRINVPASSSASNGARAWSPPPSYATLPQQPNELSLPTSSTTVLLVRAHQFTDGALKRLADLAAQCTSASPPVSLWVSLDTTMVAGEADRLRAFLKLRLHTTNTSTASLLIHEYNSTDMLTSYPALSQAHSRAKRQWRSRSLAFGFHTEAISLWYQRAAQRGHHPRTVWSMESDVGYSGTDITLLFRDYMNNTADLLTHRCRSIANTWWHTEVASDTYKQRIPRPNRTWSGEYVQRYSRRLLEAILRMNNDGMHAWSEQSTCSMAAAANLTWEPLSLRHIGIPFTFRHVKSKSFPTEDVWEAILKHPKKRDKLYHPVKF
jgi:hypothetical protein